MNDYDQALLDGLVYAGPVSPYGDVTHRARLLTQGYRCTAYWYATQRGLPITMCYLLELGIRAARTARWLGIEQVTLCEGPLYVNAWSEEIWDAAAADIARDPAMRHAHPHPPVPESWFTAWQYALHTRLLVNGGDEEDTGFVAAMDRYAWYVGGRRRIPGQYGNWPESVWDDVTRAMADRAANRGDTVLDEADLDAVADGFWPYEGDRLMARVVHCQREPYDVYVGRPGPWGNPFEIGRDGTREQVIAKHAAWIVTQPHLMARVGELRHKVLGCWCKPEPCHGDTLAALADRVLLPFPFAQYVTALPARRHDPEPGYGYWEAGDYG